MNAYLVLLLLSGEERKKNAVLFSIKQNFVFLHILFTRFLFKFISQASEMHFSTFDQTDTCIQNIVSVPKNSREEVAPC